MTEDEIKEDEAKDALEVMFDNLRRQHEPQHFMLYWGVLFAQGLEWLDTNGHKELSDENLQETLYRITKYCGADKLERVGQ